jgi:hypothetical protein
LNNIKFINLKGNFVMKNLKRVLAGIILFALIGATGFTTLAANTNDTGTGSVSGNVTINGQISPLVISVTHPLTAAYAIDPNGGTNGSFTAPGIDVQNNTRVAVNVSVAAISASSGGSLTFTDVDSSAKQWGSLNLADSKKYIALGIKAKDASGWNAGYNTATHWAVDTNATLIGALAPQATGALMLNAFYGLTFDGSYTSEHTLVFMFQLV